MGGKPLKQLNTEIIHEMLEHIRYHHHDADGYITLAKKEKGKNGQYFKQWHYRIDELEQVLNEWQGYDVYFSQNTFYRPFRTIENIRELRALYVDLDTYNIKDKNFPNAKYTNEQILMRLEHDYFKKIVPDPNLIIHSGRGMVLVWLIEPAPYKALPRWQAVENYLYEQLKELGADSKATDASRIFRIAGTRNSKSKRKVRVEYRHDYLYDLEELKHEYLETEEKSKKKSDTKVAKKENIYKQHKITNNIKRLYNIFTLHYTRLQDIIKLLELRNYDVKGHREIFLFLYRYWNCCFLKDTDEALQQTLALNEKFTEPLSKREVINATKSAEKAYEAWIDEKANSEARKKGYVGAGYNYSNEKLIELLGITAEEQKHLMTIISKKEKQRRNTLAKRNKRREQGVKERDEYITEQKEITNQRLEELRTLIAEYPLATNKELAEMLGVSVPYVKKLKKQL